MDLGRWLRLRLRLRLQLWWLRRRLRDRNRIPINEWTSIWRWRNSQGEFRRAFPSGRVVAIVARDGGSEKRDGGGRHSEIVLPLTRQKQLVGVSGGSQIGGIVGGHFGRLNGGGYKIESERECGG